MYHCHIQFYLIGVEDVLSESVKEITPLKNFTYAFCESNEPETEKIAQADVLFVSLQRVDVTDVKETLQMIYAHKKKTGELILLVDMEQVMSLPEDLSAVEDIWTMPMSEKEFGFRLQKWLRDYKRKKDFWQSEQFMNLCINSSPNLIWFKDKDGVHEIVNDIKYWWRRRCLPLNRR